MSLTLVFMLGRDQLQAMELAIPLSQRHPFRQQQNTIQKSCQIQINQIPLKRSNLKKKNTKSTERRVEKYRQLEACAPRPNSSKIRTNSALPSSSSDDRSSALSWSLSLAKVGNGTQAVAEKSWQFKDGRGDVP